LIYESENTNSFKLIEDLDLFTSPKLSRRRLPEGERFTIPSGTVGRFVSDDSSKVAMLDFEHSALALLGKRLEINDPYATALPLLTPEEVAEGIALIATLIRTAALKNPQSPTMAVTQDSTSGMTVLKEASKIVSRTKDII